MKTCAICPVQIPDNRVVCSNACHIEQLRRVRIDPVLSAQARARIGFNVRRSHADPDTKARISEAQRRRWERA